MTWINSIKNYTPYNEQEEKDKKVIVANLYTTPNILTRENTTMHLTSSGYIVNPTRDKVLMIHHNIYNSWSWTGGHCDGDSNFLRVAIKEAKEETGVINIKSISTDIFSLDVLPVNGHIKNGSYVSPHLHLSVAYLLEADETNQLFIKEDENSGVKWISIDDLHIYCTEKHMLTLYNKFNEKIKKFI